VTGAAILEPSQSERRLSKSSSSHAGVRTEVVAVGQYHDSWQHNLLEGSLCSLCMFHYLLDAVFLFSQGPDHSGIRSYAAHRTWRDSFVSLNDDDLTCEDCWKVAQRTVESRLGVKSPK